MKRIFISLCLTLALSACSAGCLSPWTTLSDSPRGTPGYHRTGP